MPSWLATAVTMLLGAGAGSIGTTLINAWVNRKATRAQADKIKTETAVDAAGIYSGLIKTLQEECQKLGDKVTQCQMENEALREELERHRQQIQELQYSVSVYQHQARTKEKEARLARDHAHLRDKFMGSYEMHAELLLDEIRKHNDEWHGDALGKIDVTPMMRTIHIRKAFAEEKAKLEPLESIVTNEIIKGDATIPSPEREKSSSDSGADPMD